MQIKEQIDTRSGRPQLLSNISVLSSISSFLSTSLGPRGLDKLFDQSFSNDGLFILQNIPKTHPIHTFVLSLAKSQDSLSGDGTTSVVLLLCEILNSLKPLLNIDVNHLIKDLTDIMNQCLEFVDEFCYKGDEFYDSDADSIDYFNNSNYSESSRHRNGSNSPNTVTVGDTSNGLSIKTLKKLSNNEFSQRNLSLQDLVSIAKTPLSSKILKDHAEFFAHIVIRSLKLDRSFKSTDQKTKYNFTLTKSSDSLNSSSNSSNSDHNQADTQRISDVNSGTPQSEISGMPHQITDNPANNNETGRGLNGLTNPNGSQLLSNVTGQALRVEKDVTVHPCIIDNHIQVSEQIYHSRTSDILPNDITDLSYLSNLSKPTIDPLILRVPGGSFTDSFLFDGIVFQKPFTYAGYEQLVKHFKTPKILLTTVELEWMAEKDNAEVVVKVQDYQKSVDAEYEILRRKLNFVVDSGAKIVLSSRSVGDFATQFFAKKKMFCAGRVDKKILERIQKTCGGRILSNLDGCGSENVQSSRSITREIQYSGNSNQDGSPHFDDLGANISNQDGLSVSSGQKSKSKATHNDSYISSNNPLLASCSFFEEKQLGKERYIFICNEKASTIVLRGPGKAILGEMERSIQDSLQVVKKNTKGKLLTGGGSLEMYISKKLSSLGQKSANRFVYDAISKAFEGFVGILARNMGLATIQVIESMRKNEYFGVGLNGVRDMRKEGVFEPASVKKNVIMGAFNGALSILSIECTIFTQEKQQ